MNSTEHEVISTPSTTGHTILLVDDEEAARTITGIILRRANHKVIEAASGEEALKLFEEHQSAIALVVSDIVMPGMLGTELVQRLIDRRPELRVLLISGYTWSLPPALLRNDHVAFLGKPFRAAELVSEIDHLTSGAGASRHLDVGWRP